MKCGIFNTLLLAAVSAFVSGLLLDALAGFHRRPQITRTGLLTDTWRLLRPELYNEKGQRWRRYAIWAYSTWAILFLGAGLIYFYLPNDGSQSKCFLTPPIHEGGVTVETGRVVQPVSEAHSFVTMDQLRR